MKKIRGIVVEVNKKHLVLLTPGGSFQRVPHPGGEIKRGEEVNCRASRSIWPKAAASAAIFAAAAILLVAIFPAGSPTNDLIDGIDPVQGYLAVDINPSLELAFNEELELTAFRPLNDDAALLLKDLQTGAELFDVVELLLERAVTLGFLDPGESENIILMTLVRAGEADNLSHALADLVEEKLIQFGIPGSVGIFEADGRDRDQVLESGISLNRHLLIKALQAQGVEAVTSGDLPVAALVSALHDKFPFSEFRSAVGPELPPSVPFDAENLPGPPDQPVDLPDQPEQAENKSGNVPALPGLPAPDLAVLVDKPEPPNSLP